MYWKNEPSHSLWFLSPNHTCVDIVSKGDVHWRFVGIYVWPKEENKHKI